MATKNRPRRYLSTVPTGVAVTITGAAPCPFASKISGTLRLINELMPDGPNVWADDSNLSLHGDTITGVSSATGSIALTADSPSRPLTTHKLNARDTLTLTGLAIEPNIIELDAPGLPASGRFTALRRKLA